MAIIYTSYYWSRAKSNNFMVHRYLINIIFQKISSKIGATSTLGSHKYKFQAQYMQQSLGYIIARLECYTKIIYISNLIMQSLNLKKYFSLYTLQFPWWAKRPASISSSTKEPERTTAIHITDRAREMAIQSTKYNNTVLTM